MPAAIEVSQYSRSRKEYEKEAYKYMIKGHESIERITQNLMDAGCNEAMISCFFLACCTVIKQEAFAG